MKKGMGYLCKLSRVSEEWLITRIDAKYRPIIEEKVTITVTATSVIFKDGAKVLKKKKAKKASTA